MSDHGGSATNAFEHWRWNDDYWTSTWPAREQLTDFATGPLLAAASVAPGDRVLDVGCGCGATTIAAARAAGPRGAAVGADISRALLAEARRLALGAGATNATFVEVDLQVGDVRGAPFDVVLSRFGVMFFEHPDVAFSNLRRHTAPGGRVAFACWQPQTENPWWLGHAIGEFLSPPKPAPGAHATGPFAFSDPEDVTQILGGAGWANVSFEPRRGTVTVDKAAIADPGQPAFLGVAADRLDEAIAAMDAHASSFARDDGKLDVPVAIFVVTARNGA